MTRHTISSHTGSWQLVLSLLFALSASLSGVTQQDVSPLNEIEDHHIQQYKQLRPSVVAITCQVPDDNPKAGPYVGGGAIISDDGYVLTSTSVVPPGAEDINLILHDHSETSARFVGGSLRNEIALLKMNGNGYEHLSLRNSKKVNIGDQIYTAGDAFSLANQQGIVSFSTGIISGIYDTESVYWQSQYSGLQIETDSSINPGSDGGPVIDQQGNLIGIISLTTNRARWMGMAVPSEEFSTYVEELMIFDEGQTTPPERPPHLGVELALQQKETTSSVIVKNVTEGSPAWVAGFRQGDVIYQADGTKIQNLSDFDQVMKEKEPGDTFLIYIKREAQRWSLFVRVGSKPV